MANAKISQIKVGEVVYDIQDAVSSYKIDQIFRSFFKATDDTGTGSYTAQSGLTVTGGDNHSIITSNQDSTFNGLNYPLHFIYANINLPECNPTSGIRYFKQGVIGPQDISALNQIKFTADGMLGGGGGGKQVFFNMVRFLYNTKQSYTYRPYVQLSYTPRAYSASNNSAAQIRTQLRITFMATSWTIGTPANDGDQNPDG